MDVGQDEYEFFDRLKRLKKEHDEYVKREYYTANTRNISLLRYSTESIKKSSAQHSNFSNYSYAQTTRKQANNICISVS